MLTTSKKVATYIDVILSHGKAVNSKICKKAPRTVIPVAHFPHQLECKMYSPVFAKYKAGTAIKKCLII